MNIMKGLSGQTDHNQSDLSAPQLHDKPYFIEADMSKFLALIIDSMNHSTSISAVMNPTDKIHDLLAKRNMR